jgi:nucleotide-binding universal stress UspA family protein
MTYASIMVHMAVGFPNDGVLRIGAALASRTKASVVGIAASAPLPVVYAECYSNEGLVDADLAALVEETDEAEARFRAAMAGMGGEITWRSMVRDVPPSDFVAREARAADLVVTGPEVGWFTGGSSHSLITGDLLLKAGRPLLIASDKAADEDLRNVLVAWKDTREARRAIADALPLLALADHVCVVEVADQDRVAAARGRLDDVVGWLRSHGVAAEGLAVEPTGSDAAQLRALVQGRGAGIVVGGAYGHARLREWVFGGVTRNLLLRPDRCSFVSH